MGNKIKLIISFLLNFFLRLIPKRSHHRVEIFIENLSKYINEEAPKVFPEMVKLLDAQLTVRLVSYAGSLAKLARLPSSTIQLLGAEKALFRHMSDGSLPPKHGILYQHPSVKGTHRKKKGFSHTIQIQP